MTNFMKSCIKIQQYKQSLEQIQINNHRMGCITIFIGRLLFVTLLVSSAYLHISKPQNYQKDFAHGYEHIREHINQFYPLLSTINVNWNMWIQIYGAFQFLIALLIISGDRLGGILLLISLIVSGTARFCHIDQFLQWESSKQLEFAQFLTMIGASLILSSSTKKRVSCQQSKA